MKHLFVISLFLFVDQSILGQSVFIKKNHWEKGNPVVGYEYSHDSIISLSLNKFLIRRSIDSTITYTPDEVIRDTNQATELLRINFDSVSSYHYIHPLSSRLYPPEQFNYLKSRNYRIGKEKIIVYCFGHIRQEIDGDYAIYVTNEYSYLGTSTISWGYYSILYTRETDGNKHKLIKMLSRDTSFFPVPRLKEKHKLKEYWP